MTTTLRHQIRIAAPPHAVWDVLSDLVAVERYNPMVASATIVSDDQEGVGAVRHCELKPRGWIEERVWDWSPERAIAFEVSASQWPIVFMKWKTELEPDRGATIVSQEMTYEMQFGFFGALLNFVVMRRKLDRSVQSILENLRRHIEAQRRW